MKIVNDNLCTFCGEAKESTVHVYCQCPKISSIWDEIAKHFHKTYDVKIEFSKKEKLTGTCGDQKYTKLKSLVSMVTKQSIYSDKCTKQRATAQVIIKEIEFIHEIERKNAITYAKIRLYNRKCPDKISIGIVKCEKDGNSVPPPPR